MYEYDNHLVIHIILLNLKITFFFLDHFWLVNFEIEAFCEMYFQIWPSPKTYPEFFFCSYDSISSKNTAQSKNVETNQKIIGQAFFYLFLRGKWAAIKWWPYKCTLGNIDIKFSAWLQIMIKRGSDAVVSKYPVW